MNPTRRLRKTLGHCWPLIAPTAVVVVSTVTVVLAPADQRPWWLALLAVLLMLGWGAVVGYFVRAAEEAEELDAAVRAEVRRLIEEAMAKRAEAARRLAEEMRRNAPNN